MKYHIEKNTVQETLVIPLYGRKMCSTLYPRLFYDETAIRLMDEIDYPAGEEVQKPDAALRLSGGGHAAE